MAEPTVLSALRIEALAAGRGATAVGMGPDRAAAGTARVAGRLDPGAPVAVAGVAGALAPGVHRGDVVVATELWSGEHEPRQLAGAHQLAGELRRTGLTVHAGPVLCSRRFTVGRELEPLVASGALAVEMESAWIADALGDRPFAVVRAISDVRGRGMVSGGIRALGALRRARPAIERWGHAVRPRTVLLAAPRSFCAGVERAIETVERALELHGAPVYVRRQIVHNQHVVRSLEERGAVFVRELDEVPDGATVVIAAHGVSPEIHRQAAARPDLAVIDATCPLVAKVHNEARRFAARGHDIVLIGHADHEEVVGTMGEAPDRIHLVERAEDVASLPVPDGGRVAYLTQTTLATDETAAVVDALTERFPSIVGPAAADICYASQNRQDAVRDLAGQCDLVLVVGSTNSSNTARLVEVARRHDCRAELVEDETGIDLAWLEDAATVGVTAGASAPEALVQQVVAALGGLGPADVREHRAVEETVRFTLPQQVR